MKVFEFLKLVGKEALYTYEVHWFISDGTEVYISTEFAECVEDLFGEKMLCETDSVYFFPRENKPILLIYIL